MYYHDCIQMSRCVNTIVQLLHTIPTALQGQLVIVPTGASSCRYDVLTFPLQYARFVPLGLCLNSKTSIISNREKCNQSGIVTPS